MRSCQCFICGKVVNREEFNKHIFESHEEGREYIKCPLERCQAPVRDLRVHFRAKHKYDKIPKGCQLKATVYYDVKNPKKRRKLPSFKDGNIISKKNNGKEMHYRSSYEQNVYLSLESINEVVKYDVEPFSVGYYYNGKYRRYYPDLKVVFNDGHIEIWEIKPQNQIHLAQNQAKWNACKFHCMNRGWNFQVVTEDYIKELKSKAK